MFLFASPENSFLSSLLSQLLAPANIMGKGSRKIEFSLFLMTSLKASPQTNTFCVSHSFPEAGDGSLVDEHDVNYLEGGDISTSSKAREKLRKMSHRDKNKLLIVTNGTKDHHTSPITIMKRDNFSSALSL